MPFGMVSWVGRGGVLDEVVIVEGKGAVLGVNWGVPLSPMGPLLRSCAEVRAAIELSFGMVSGVGPGIGVLDGGPHASRGRGYFWDFSAFVPPFVRMGRMTYCLPRNVFVCEKLTIFPYRQDIVGNVVLLAF